MFGMLPFERSDDNLFDTFDNFTRNFFRGSNASLPAFRPECRCGRRAGKECKIGRASCREKV